MAHRAARIAIAAVLAGMLPAGSGGTPAAAPSAQAARRGGAPDACRTGLATYRIVTRGGGFTSTTEGSCSFDAATVEGTCTNDYSDGTGRRFRSVSVTRHATIADVVDEVSVNPPRQLARGTTTTVTGAGADSTGVSTLEYRRAEAADFDCRRVAPFRPALDHHLHGVGRRRQADARDGPRRAPDQHRDDELRRRAPHAVHDFERRHLHADLRRQRQPRGGHVPRQHGDHDGADDAADL